MHFSCTVRSLGYIVSAEGFREGSGCYELAQSQIPARPCRGFWALSIYLPHFIRNFSQLAAPLTALTSTKTAFRWSSGSGCCILQIQKALFQLPSLLPPDPSWQFVVEVDASEMGVDAVLSQRSLTDGKVHPCTYF